MLLSPLVLVVLQEGRYSSMTEEAEQKTKKLKKLWKKFQEVRHSAFVLKPLPVLFYAFSKYLSNRQAGGTEKWR